MNDDLISRKWLMECVEEGWVKFETEKDENKFIHLVRDTAPPARSGIIRCRDCKHYKAYEYTGRLACHYVIGGAVVRNPDDFCSRAERLRNGSD